MLLAILLNCLVIGVQTDRYLVGVVKRHNYINRLLK